MKTLKIVLALAAVIGLVTVTVGLSFAHYTGTIPFNPTTNTGTPFDPTPRSVQDTFDQDWWTRMREYMEARWTGIEDETWFNEMTQYMEEHYNEVLSQEWFDQMLEYMEDRGYYNYGPSNYANNNYGPNNYGRRGHGCWGW